MTKKLRVGYGCLVRLSFDAEYAKRLMERSIAALSAMDIELVHLPDFTITEQDAEELAACFVRERVEVALIQYGTFSLGTIMPILAQRMHAPIVLWGVPEPQEEGGRLRSNSLCGINMNAHTLMRLGRAYDFVFRQPEEAAPDLDRVFRVLGSIERLKHVRLGLVGYRVPGFYTSTCDEMEVRKRFGVEVHHVPLAEVWDEAMKSGAAERERDIVQIRASASMVEVPDAEVDKAAALYLGFRKVAERYNLNSLAVKCWPEFPDSFGIATCSTLGRLNDDDIVTSCEGDVYGAVTMLLERYLSGRTPMFADFISIDEERNHGIAWHCGAAPPSLAGDAVQVRLHSTVGGGGKKGVTAEFPIKAGGPVTMARIGPGRNGLRMFFAGGEAVKPYRLLRGNPLGIEFHVPVRRLVEIIIEEGVEHHFSFVHADIRSELRSVARWLNLPTLDVDAMCDSGKGSNHAIQTLVGSHAGV